MCLMCEWVWLVSLTWLRPQGIGGEKVMAVVQDAQAERQIGTRKNPTKYYKHTHTHTQGSSVLEA